ncbi:hypothetical protein ABZU22_01165 [Micromonospora sp. NPDC005222]|uniref:hypothetical protein n=1 Tax=unclassified Micromonospora TaxID=2617518 RepID=UPI0033A3CAEC
MSTVATGYARGTITPFGSTTAGPVVADAALAATVADVTDEEPARAAVAGARRPA